jgi:hypothetical protein
MQSVNNVLRDTQSTLAEALAAYVRNAEAMQQLHRHAEHHGSLPRNSPVARELVADVIGDICMGDTRCDPDRELVPQLERYVARRARRLRKDNQTRSKRREGQRLEFIALDEAPASALMVDPLQKAFDDDGARDAADMVVRIRDYAREDEPAQQLLALYDRELVLRRDVLRAGMTEWAYRTARERLVQYAEMAAAAGSATAAAA